MKKAIQHGLRVIRIYQKDIWEDKNNWENVLKYEIENSHKIKCIKSGKDFVDSVYMKYETEIDQFLSEENEPANKKIKLI